MTERMTRVRVSVREKTSSRGSWDDTQPAYSHLRYQILESLVPLSGNRIFEQARSGFEADYEALARHKPQIQDGWRVVVFDDGTPVLYLDVEKRVQRGKKQHLFLRESPTPQS